MASPCVTSARNNNNRFPRINLYAIDICSLSRYSMI